MVEFVWFFYKFNESHYLKSFINYYNNNIDKNIIMRSPLGIASVCLLIGLSASIIITTPCASVALTDCNASGYCTLSADSLTC